MSFGQWIWVGGVVLLAAVAVADTTFYVAEDGNDAWSGTLPAPNAAGDDGPFASLTRARDAIRALKQANGGSLAEPVAVHVREGFYFLLEPLVLSPGDSGAEACPVTYAAYPNERVVISGGRRIGGWRKGTDGVWRTTVPEVASGAWTFRQLFIGDDSDARRYRPNRGAFLVAALTDAPARDVRSRHVQSQDEFHYYPGDIEAWENLDDVEAVVLHDWTASRLRIRELAPSSDAPDAQPYPTVRFTGYPVYRVGHWYANNHNPYYMENVKEAFGTPGEWHLDRPSGELAYTPRPGEDLAKTPVYAPHTTRLVQLKGDPGEGAFVDHVRFSGLEFRYTGWQWPAAGYSSRQGMIDLPSAFEARGARHCRIEGCTFAHLGAYAVNFGAGCHDNAVVGNRMYDLGGGGVKVGVTKPDAVAPELPTNNEIGNNVISDGGLIHFSAHGVWVGIVQRAHVHHNIVRRFLYSTVSGGWKWDESPTSCREILFEYNHIHDAMMLLADGGGIYTLGFQPGTVMRGNLIHDVHRSPYAGRAPNNGFFFDQGSKGFLVENAIIYNTAGDPVRHNQSQHDWLTWKDNYIGIAPDSPEFPKELAAKAGLEAEYRHLDAAPTSVPMPPLLAMPYPKVPNEE
ncbi:MAG: right-handed parallel beta-helix repeat-containing protein [bacterium]|nr:right-handed parallel beta-helix repeat-containing protein [bacterium]